MTNYRGFSKRFIDLVISSILLILFSPIVIVMGLISYFKEGNPIFFSQSRIGFLNQSFTILKFRTMSGASNGARYSVADDPRITPFGGFLRKFKFDELPQLINVLKGDMSLVGARPVLRENFLKFPRKSQFYMYRSQPGITGIASLYFFNEEQLLLTCQMDQKYFFYEYLQPFKGELEIWYQKNLSLVTDLKILFATIWVLLVKNNEILFSLFKDLPKFDVHETRVVELSELQKVS